MIGGMITKQQQLDTALKIKAKSAKGVVDIYYSFQSDFRYTELVRVEGSSQALFTTLFNRVGGMFLYRFSGFDQFIRETLNNFWKELLIKESMATYQVWYDSIEKSEKRSKAYDFFIDKRRSSTGVIEIFDTAQPECDSRFGALYSLTVARCIEEILIELNSQDWTITPFTDFLSSDRMLEVRALFDINAVKIVDALKESLNPKSGVIDFGQFDTNFVNNLPTYISLTKPKASSNWNWRFKTEEEFIDQYGGNWKPKVTKGITAWLDDMDYLLGKPIIESKEAKEYIKISQTGYYFNVLDKFDIANTANPSENYWEISKDMLINKPLSNAVAPTTQTTTTTLSIKPMYYGLESTYNAFYPTQNTVKIENRFSYMDWEDVVRYYELAKKESDTARDAFCYAVAVLNNTSRMKGELNSSIVKSMLENNTPSDALKELFSNKYYFSPLYFNFYTSLYDKIEDSIINAGWTRTIVTNQKLQSLINIADTTANLGSTTGVSGIAGLGNFRETNQKKIYPDIITTGYESDQKNAYAYDATSLADYTIEPFVENLSYNNDNWYDTVLQKSAVPLITTLSGSYSRYEDLSDVPTDMIYSGNSQSKLDDHLLYKGGIGNQPDFMFWDFARPLLPQNFFILADFSRLLLNFYIDDHFNSTEVESLKDVGERLQIRSDLKNSRFLVNIQDIPFTKQGDIISRLDGWNQLSNEQKLLFIKFMTLYDTVVVQKAREKIAEIFEETTTGVMQRSGVGYMPTSTTPLPTAATPATQKQVKTIKEIPYIEFLENGVLTKTQTIVGARFMTMQEIKDNEKKYDTTFYGLYSTAVDVSFSGYDAAEIKKYFKDNIENTEIGNSTKELLGVTKGEYYYNENYGNNQ
jgi:hypothetical protein